MTRNTSSCCEHDAVYKRVPTDVDGAAIPASALFSSIYSSLGTWLGSNSVQPATGPTQHDGVSESEDRAQSIIQALEDMGTRALQAAALNVCLPANGWLRSAAESRFSSKSGSTSSAAQHPMRPPSSATGRRSAERDLAVGSSVRDTRKLAGQQCGHKPVSGSVDTDQQAVIRSADAFAATSTKPAPETATDTPSRLTALLTDNEQLHRELTCCRASLAALYLICSRLRQENQHLSRVSDCSGEELLSDALEQLLREKNQLQQEVVRLRQQNTALQELLEYTAPAAAQSASGPSTAWGLGDCRYETSSSNNAAMTAAALTEAGSIIVNSEHAGVSHHLPAFSDLVSTRAVHQSLLDKSHGVDCQQQQQQHGLDNDGVASEFGSMSDRVSGDVAETPGDLDPGSKDKKLRPDGTEVVVAAARTVAVADQMDSTAAQSEGFSIMTGKEGWDLQQGGRQCSSSPVTSCCSVVIDAAVVGAFDVETGCPWQQQQQNKPLLLLKGQHTATRAAQPCRQLGRQQHLRLDAASSKVVSLRHSQSVTKLEPSSEDRSSLVHQQVLV